MLEIGMLGLTRRGLETYGGNSVARQSSTLLARWGLEEAQSKSAGRRTGTGYEVWYIRDEWARDHEVLHP